MILSSLEQLNFVIVSRSDKRENDKIQTKVKKNNRGMK